MFFLFTFFNLTPLIRVISNKVVFIQCLLGDKYGYRPFPYKIKATEFEMLLEVAQETYDQPEHIAILKEWYWKVRWIKL